MSTAIPSAQTLKKGRLIYKRLLKFTRQYWGMFIIGMLATIILSLTDAGFTWLVKPIINQGFIARDVHFIRLLPPLIIGILIIRGFSSFASTYFITRVARNVVMDFRQRIFNHLMILPARFYDKHSSGYLLSTIIYNVEQVAQASSDALVNILRESSLFVGLLVVMFLVNWQLTLTFIVMAPIMSWIMKKCSRRLRRLSTHVQESVGDVTHVAEEGIENYKVIRLYGGEDYETEKFAQTTQLNRHRELKIVVTNSLGTSSMQMLVGIPLALILMLATIPSFHVTAGSLASIVAAMIGILRPVRRLTEVNNYIQRGIAAVESIFDLLDTEAEKDHGTRTVARVQGHIEFKNVSLQYVGTKKKALDHVSFKIEPNKTIAIVGRSGAGKTSLINLLPRFYETTEGDIYLDNMNIRDLTLKDLRKQFALVSQHTTLFNDTIRHNIAYGNQIEKASDEKVFEAAKAAYALEFIENLPDGFETVVGENGVLLSGGQRQRLAIARALLRNAPILILDEATASLDTHSERKIQAALDCLIKNRTTLVIAHRLSTIENADWILVFDKGYLVEQGTHAALLSQGGAYAELHKLQFKSAVQG